MRGVALTMLLVLGACDGGKNDIDGDGHDSPLDCNDDDPKVFPGADEVCDGVDNDCNGVVDDGMGQTLYEDNDGDGFGSPAGQLFCDNPEGYATVGGDCDDTNPAVNPDAIEDCTDVDMNCDGDATLNAAAPTWYVDSDQDGYGRDDITLVQCEGPAGYASEGGDCQDSVADVNPAATELCDGIDNDCNDTIDDNAIDSVSVYTDADGDTYGDDASSFIGCPAPGAVLTGGDCDDIDPLINPGADEVCDGGIDNDCDPATDEEQVDGVAYYVDADSDGFGVTGSSVYGCTQPPYSSQFDGDCDDVDPSAYPGGTEVCGGGDEDCDGGIDNNASDGVSYYPDLDGDSYGDTLSGVVSCAAVPGYILDGQDCDDADPLINPDTLWYTDVDMDGHGDPAAVTASCLQPPDTSPLGDDCDDNDPTSYPGNIEICDGYVDNDCDPATNEDLTATWFFDGDGDGYGTDSDTVNGCTPPPMYIQVSGDCDDTDPLLNPTMTPDCIQDHCGTIALSQTWKNTVEHTVSCDIDVKGAAKPTLTVQDGAIVRFAGNTELRIGDGAEGRLYVPGASVGVLFTSDEPFPIPGDWDGVLLGPNDQGSDVIGLTVEYAGNNGKGGILIEGGDPTLDQVTSRSNLGDGLYVTGSEPLVTNSVFIDNTDNGLYVGVGAGLSRFDALGTLGPSFQGNVLVNNGGRPITVTGSHADEIDLTNVVAPNNTAEIELLTGTLRFTGTWFDHGIPYVVAEDDVIQVEDGPQAQLYIEDGVDIYFNSDAELQIGDGAEGYLEIIDGPQGVLMSATQAVIALSDNWNGLKFGTDDGGSFVQNLTIEYGGGNGKGNLYVVGSAPVFINVVSQLSDSSGLYVSGTAAPDISNSMFVDNDVHGVYVESASGIARSLLGPTFANNLLTGNGQSPVVLPPNFLGELDPSTAFSGNGTRIGVHGGTVLEDAIWRRLDEDYQVQGTLTIQGPQDPVVEIEDGVDLWFERNLTFNVGTGDDGALIINAPTLGVLMTSADAAPGEGDWFGLKIGNNGPLRAQPSLLGLTVEYAGGSDVGIGAAIEVIDRNGCASPDYLVDLDQITVLASSKYGIHIEDSTRVGLDDITISGSLDGCMYGVTHAGGGQCALKADTYSNVDCLTGLTWGSWPLEETDKLDPTSIYTGPVTIRNTTLKESVVMAALPVPYTVLDVIAVKDNATPRLTVPGGATLEFAANAGLEIADGSPGGIVIQSGALLTSSAQSPAPGDWQGVLIADEVVDVDIRGATIEYAGGNFTAALWLDAAAPTGLSIVDQTTLTDSSTCGIYDDVASTVTIGTLFYGGNLGGDYCP